MKEINDTNDTKLNLKTLSLSLSKRKENTKEDGVYFEAKDINDIKF